jgi:hypothetical protein
MRHDEHALLKALTISEADADLHARRAGTWEGGREGGERGGGEGERARAKRYLGDLGDAAGVCMCFYVCEYV